MEKKETGPGQAGPGSQILSPARPGPGRAGLDRAGPGLKGKYVTNYFPFIFRSFLLCFA